MSALCTPGPPAVHNAGAPGPPHRGRRLGRRTGHARRSLRLARALPWLLDGALQLQPFMFTKGFAQQVIAPAATGSPPSWRAPSNWGAHLIAAHAVAGDALFAGVQLALAWALLLTRRTGTVRVAIAASVLWAGASGTSGKGLGGAAGR